MKRPFSQTREDIEILDDALRRKEQWRFDIVRARVAADFEELGNTLLIALASDPKALLDGFRILLADAESKRDTPETKAAGGSPW